MNALSGTILFSDNNHRCREQHNSFGNLYWSIFVEKVAFIYMKTDLKVVRSNWDRQQIYSSGKLQQNWVFDDAFEY